jgi:hypothetical protein
VSLQRPARAIIFKREGKDRQIMRSCLSCAEFRHSSSDKGDCRKMLTEKVV